MAVYTSDSAFYDAMQALFEGMRTQAPNPIDQFAAKKLLVRMRFTNPAALIVVNGRRSPVSIHYGAPPQPATSRPDLDVEMSVDTLHQILLDNLSLKRAIASRQIKVTGALWKTGSLGAILERGRLLYPEIARQHLSTRPD